MICRVCGKDESAGPFRINKSEVHKGVHKHCHSFVENNKRKTNAALLKPWLWAQCDDCDHIYSLHKYGMDNKNCPKCKSTNTMTFKQMLGENYGKALQNN